jgi:Protein of unknown function (DUF3306)
VAEQKDVPVAEGLSLSRWSRLKRQAAADARTDGVSTSVHPERSEGSYATISPSNPSLRSGRTAVEAAGDLDAELKLPPLSAISLTEDFTPFMQAKVPQALKQQAFKALFKEPHFNVMDGLDIYIDDYTKFEPISPEVMGTLSSWKTIMNPTKQVVTDDGYAVDETSEEGKAVLAARAKLADAAPNPSDEIAAVASDSPADATADDAAPVEHIAVVSHPRHGKRVGEFSYTDTPLISPESEAADVTAASTATPIEKFQ